MSNRIPAGNSTPQIGNVQGLANLVAAFLITPSGANLLAALTTKTGTNLPVFSDSPTLSLPSFNNLRPGYDTTVCASGTTTLTVNSNEHQYFTGTLPQTMVLPVASTMTVGMRYYARNNSTGILTVQSSGLNTIFAQPADTRAIYTCILASGTGIASWSASYVGFSAITGTGANVLADSPTFTGTVTIPAGVVATAANAGYMGIPQNAATTGAYGVVAADNGTHIRATATRTVTLPANATIALPIGFAQTFTCDTGATMTIAITTDTMYLAGPGTTGSRTLAPFGMATAIKTGATSWMISGNGLT